MTQAISESITEIAYECGFRKQFEIGDRFEVVHQLG